MLAAGEVTPKRLPLTEVAAKELLAAHGIPVVPTALARSPTEAVRLAKRLGLPVVLKVALAALEDILLKLSALAEQRPDLNAIDLNPIFAYPEGALAVDARVLLA